MTATPPPAVGQIWEDADPRGPRRRFRIVALEDTHALVESTASGRRRRTRVRLDRLQPGARTYRYVTSNGATA